MENTQVAEFRRGVLRHIAEYTWNDCLPDHIYDILYQTVRDNTPRVRCCVHKERAVLKNRIQMALWQPLGENIINAANAALRGDFDVSLPVVDVLPDACDACPIDKYYVTDLCRHCIQHNCTNNCPKHAISIQHNRAAIDRDVCIECGRCAQSCPYGAIMEIIRPCIRACALGAMASGPDTRTIIDHDKCVNCGNCRSACPFGALDERSMIVQILLALKQKKNVVAMLAPSFVGQFGANIGPAQIVSGLKRLGFSEVVEVAVGADITTLREAEEFCEKVPESISFMTSSCCPAFVDLVKKHFPGYAGNISETVSPMISCGQWVKERFDGAMACFIGPCIAKKTEAIRSGGSVDFAMTYEELLCVFEGVGIELDAPASGGFRTSASADGLGFPLKRGVQRSLGSLLGKKGRPVVAMEYADGLDRCHEKLSQLKNGTLAADYLEGMACRNGCLDGPGALSPFGMTRVLLTKLAEAAETQTSDEKPEATAALRPVFSEGGAEYGRIATPQP